MLSEPGKILGSVLLDFNKLFVVRNRLFVVSKQTLGIPFCS